MRLFMIFLTAVLVAIVLSSLVAQPLYQLSGSAALVDFDNFAKRLAMLAILLTVVAILKYQGMLHARNVGWSIAAGTVSRRALVGYGLIAGVLMMLPVTLLFHGLELRVLSLDAGFAWPAFLAKLALLLLAAFAVSLIEETFFRGVLYNGFLHERRPAAAVLLSALFFSTIHFARIKGSELPADAAWYHGLLILADGIATHWHSDYLSTALSLFLAGVLLGIVRLKSGSVWACIGLHTGWILMIKVDKNLSSFNEQSAWHGLVGPYDSYNGWATAAWLMVVAGAWLAMRGNSTATRSAAAKVVIRSGDS